MTKNQLITSIARAISRMEGYEILNSVARRNANPGNLRSWGRLPVVNGYVKFPNAEEGWRALAAQIEYNIMGKGKADPFKLRQQGLSLREFFAGQRDENGAVLPGGYPGYAPSADSNHPEHYAQFVAKAAGLDDIDKKLKEYITA